MTNGVDESFCRLLPALKKNYHHLYSNARKRQRRQRPHHARVGHAVAEAHKVLPVERAHLAQRVGRVLEQRAGEFARVAAERALGRRRRERVLRQLQLILDAAQRLVEPLGPSDDPKC